MKARPPSPSSGLQVGPRALAALVLGAALLVGAGSVFTGAWDGGRAPAPYAWPDVALVQFVCALPLALMLAAALAPRLSAGGTVAVATACLALGLSPLVEDCATEAARLLRSDPEWGIVLRSVPALGLAVGLVLLAIVLTPEQHPAGELPGRRSVALYAAIGAVALLVPPVTYIDARCRHDLVRLGEFLDQARVGEARALARGVLVLDAGRAWNGRPLSEGAEELDRAVIALESRVATPLRPYPTTHERLDRARALAMLGRTEEALEVLRPVDDPGAAPDVENLRGTIYETRGEWEPGLAAYRAARAAWERRPPSPVRDAGVLRSQIGIAYCLRKSGRYGEAEIAYREVLALSPSADSHFLLAQFYEDAQQAASAREHARRAIGLAPDRYGPAGERLIKKLSVSQFGCFGVYDAEGRFSGSGGTPGGVTPLR